MEKNITGEKNAKPYRQDCRGKETHNSRYIPHKLLQ